MNFLNKSFWIGFLTALFLVAPTLIVLFYKIDQMFDLR
jgi:uncharacterized membrane protein